MGRLNWLRHRIEYVAFAALAAVAAALPLDWASAVSGFLWRLIAPRLARQKRALDNLALALPETTEAERRRIARRCGKISAAPSPNSFNSIRS